MCGGCYGSWGGVASGPPAGRWNGTRRRILVRPAPSVVHSPESRLRGVSQEKKLAPVRSRGDGSLLACTPVRARREAIVGFNQETFPDPFLLVAGDSLDPVTPHSRHFKKGRHVLAARSPSS